MEQLRTAALLDLCTLDLLAASTGCQQEADLEKPKGQSEGESTKAMAWDMRLDLVI